MRAPCSTRSTGAAGCSPRFEAGFVQQEIQESAYRAQQAIDAETAIVVGVNRFAADDSPSIETQRIDSAVEADQAARVAALRATRNTEPVDAALAAVEHAARADVNLVRPIIAAVEAKATVGEIADTLRGVFGEYRN